MSTHMQDQNQGLSDFSIVRHYLKEHQAALQSGSDKVYPNLALVRVEKNYFLNKSGRLLDYGCGFGANLIHLAECGYSIDGIDTSKYALEKIASKLKQHPEIESRVALHLLAEEAIRLPFIDEMFDYIVCASVLSLLSSPTRIRRLMAEFQRILRVSGRIYLDVNGPNSRFAIAGKSPGGDIYELSNHQDAREVRRVYCPTSKGFADLVSAYFTIDTVGFSSHQIFNHQEEEFIICARKN